MSSSTTPMPATQPWGIYHTDREYARTLGDPLATTVEAPTKIAAEEAAAKLGFRDPWTHPIASEVAALARSVLKRHPRHGQHIAPKTSRGICI